MVRAMSALPWRAVRALVVAGASTTLLLAVGCRGPAPAAPPGSGSAPTTIADASAPPSYQMQMVFFAIVVMPLLQKDRQWPRCS